MVEALTILFMLGVFVGLAAFIVGMTVNDPTKIKSLKQRHDGSYDVIVERTEFGGVGPKVEQKYTGDVTVWYKVHDDGTLHRAVSMDHRLADALKTWKYNRANGDSTPPQEDLT